MPSVVRFCVCVVMSAGVFFVWDVGLTVLLAPLYALVPFFDRLEWGDDWAYFAVRYGIVPLIFATLFCVARPTRPVVFGLLGGVCVGFATGVGACLYFPIPFWIGCMWWLSTIGVMTVVGFLFGALIKN